MANVNSIYKAPAATALANPVTTAVVFKRDDKPLEAAILYLPPDKLDVRRFKISACGKCTGGTTTNLTVKIQQGSSTTAASNTDIATSGAIAVNSTSGNWSLVMEVVADSVSEKLQGILYGHVNATAVAQAVVTAVATGVDPADDDGVPFVVNALFSATNADNSVSLDDFHLEAL